MKVRNKVKLKIAIYAAILVLYVVGFVLIFNYKTILGIGYYHNEKNFTITYNGGSGGLNLKIYAQHIQYDDHRYGLEITAFSTPDSDLIGITYLDYRLATQSVAKRIVALNYSIPVSTYSIGYGTPLRTRLFQNNNLSCKGIADVIIKVNDVEEIHRISFDIGIIIKLDGEALAYDANALTWVYVIYLGCTMIPITLLYRSYKKLRFMKWYSEDLRERDDIFRRKITEKEESATNR